MGFISRGSVFWIPINLTGKGPKTREREKLKTRHHAESRLRTGGTQKKSQAAWGVSRPDLMMYVRDDGARSLTHSPTPAGRSGVGWKRVRGGGGFRGRPKAVIGWSAKIFTTLPEWRVWWDSGNWLCMPEFSIIVFLLRTLATPPPLWWQFFFFFSSRTRTNTHTLESQTPSLCVCRVC